MKDAHSGLDLAASDERVVASRCKANANEELAVCAVVSGCRTQ